MSERKSEWVSVMLERADAILKMKSCQLPLDLLNEFSVSELASCCGRMTAAGEVSNACTPYKNMQRELIREPRFAGWLEDLLSMLPEDAPPAAPEPACSPLRSTWGHRPPQLQKAPVSHRGAVLRGLNNFLAVCLEHGKNVSGYPAEDAVSALEVDGLQDEQRLVYLEHGGDLPADKRQNFIASLRNCTEIPLALSAGQKELLLEPCAASRYLFACTPFTDIWAFFESHPGLLDIARFLHQYGVMEELDLEDYRIMSRNASENARCLRFIASEMTAEAAGQFLMFWKRNGCLLAELLRMERWVHAHPGQDWDSLLSTRSGYVNQLYGARFRTINLGDTYPYQESILVYAIIHGKKSFIRLVDEHAGSFLAIPRASILFQERFYEDNFNLNELTEQDMKDCSRMYSSVLPAERLTSGRRYTFPELRTLYGASTLYISLYNALQSESQDYRLKVFRQLHKRELLSWRPDEQELSTLAEQLDRKPLYDWLQSDFKHIEGVTAKTAVQILAHMDKLEPLLPSIQTEADALLALRNVDLLDQFNNMSSLKQQVIQLDGAWRSLASAMALSEDFIELYWENIERFIYHNGAHIAEVYRKGLDKSQDTAFLRVVKAELMGQLNELKYFAGDLQRELSLPLSDCTVAAWRRNTREESGNMSVGEFDDFFSTMMLGIQPQRTCLAYSGGVYRECLLSSFDSNKKILYVRRNERIVGRAFLRLTRGRMPKTSAAADDDFTFVDLEHVSDTRAEPASESKNMVLFLERAYISGVNTADTARVKHLLVELARNKADQLGALLLLNLGYRDFCDTDFVQTQFEVYISRSKAGMQYLDSLDGAASVSQAGSYKTGTFMLRKQLGA